MQNSSKAGARWSILLCLFVLGLVTTLIVLPSQFASGTVASKGEGLNPKTVSHEEGIDFFDIRFTKSEKGPQILEAFRAAAGKDASFIADQKEGFVQAEEALRTTVPTLKIEYNWDLFAPETIGPDTNLRRAFLTEPSQRKRTDILRGFLTDNNELVGMSREQIGALKVQTDYTNPDGNLSFTILEQIVNDIPIHRGEVKAGFTRNGEMIRVINNLAPGLDYSQIKTDFGDPMDAVRSAAGHINHELRPSDTQLNAARSGGNKYVYGDGYYPTTAEKIYFPTEIGVVRPAWRVMIWKDLPAYDIIVDAETGTLFRRENMVKDQTQSATYNVWRNTTSSVFSLGSPAPLSPGPIDPSLGTQGPIQARSTVTLIGNEAPYTFNNNGWITDGGNSTIGNNTTAGLDRATPNGPDANVDGVARVFNFAANPPPGSPAPGDDPLPAGQTPTPCQAAPPPVEDKQRAAVTQMFYVVNRYHDELYLRGFTEAARNFQTTNFSGMGVGADAVISEGQDCSGTNNANFASSSTDGTTGRMQMYIFTGPTPDRDGTVDGDVIIHELTHGTVNRLHTGGIGAATQGGQMHEGYADWYAHIMLSNPAEPINGVYTTGGYVTLNWNANPPFSNVGNYYYGIRRFPKAVIAFTGGPMNRPHNPLTYADIDPAQINVTNGAFAPAFTGSATAVHDGGEIWSSMLWEVRERFITRLGWAAGNTKTLQLVVDGSKLAPAQPTMLQERNAIIAAAQASAAAPEAAIDVADVREGFRRRGMGFSAANPSGNTVVEAFDAPEVTASNPAVTSGNNLLEPNECNTLNVPLTNNSTNPATAISGVLSSLTPGITVTQPNSAYPDMAPGAGPINNTTPYQVSVDNTVACFTSANFSLTFTFTGGGGGSPETFNFSLPVGLAGTNYVFSTGTGGTIPAGGVLVAGSQGDDVQVSIPMPAGWSSTVYGIPVTSLNASTNGIVTANGTTSTAFTNTTLLATVGGTNPTLFAAWDDYNLATTATTNGGIFVNTIGSAPNRELWIEWRGAHFDEPDPSPVSNHFAVKLTEGSGTVQYVHVLTGIAPNTQGVSATVGIQRASTAGSPFTLAGFNTSGTIVPGMVRTGTLPGGMCTPGTGTCLGTVRSRADFDGDGRTDLSVYRPSEGNWYLNRSSAGFQVIKWGISTDTLVPGDYDNDNKTDTAIFRADANPANPDFYILNSNGFTVSGVSWGTTGDTPVVADYDNDGKSDVAVFRSSDNTWYILRSGGGITVTPFGIAGDVPVAGNFGGTAAADLTVYRAGTWMSQFTGGGSLNFALGAAGDILAPADFSGDNVDDFAVFRPSTGAWHVRNSTGGAVTITPWGSSGDVPAPGDYDGDGSDDLAIYRNGVWWVNRSSAGVLIQGFGISTDTAIPRRYLP